MALRCAALAIVAIAASCTPKSEPGSCYRDKDNVCVEYGEAQAAGGKRLCAGYRWIAGAGSCPTEGRVGSCAREGGKTIELMYSGPPNQFNAAAAKTSCESSGGSFRP
jgi:hypothetical protein